MTIYNELIDNLLKDYKSPRTQQLGAFFAHPPEIRKVIYTTNAIESLNISSRKVT